ncbi:hypothetical protein [Williamsia sp. CHRR-6]|uniref:hypothetical protein n=1 Tax=Williamsia sp. CHRR-6 TaxID=2835871 RepID=UPI001BDA5CE4|nr:hypothetical protein [Williamsia sp. CHRR-6]MBT0565589.1 hypothetical protein [Williamsia sp. CHRR-6]
MTVDQRTFIESSLGSQAVEDLSDAISETKALPVAAVAIAAAAWCARGALASVPTSVLDDISNGGAGTAYARNAIIGCLGGEIGGLVWKFLPAYLKKKAIEAVAAFVIRYIR